MSTERERVAGTTGGHPGRGGADGPSGALGGAAPAVADRVPIAELARRFELDRKTVRRCLRDPAWRPYQRPAPPEMLLTQHAEYLRAPVEPASREQLDCG
jgi:hypothetical protein